ncbi:hypothetical protein [Saccharothrix australiensis]|uniref:Uncharacterized protein n=1 Tax=Saccharothrix australiensis TaxID=2072 RepID=A0A495W1L6_9PSEU|nr:hypothetical protein [Saccharothrix australiensis]RKT55581.1 hypothetical protein C8E97_4258 [Saccharothrix australiensis]
MSFHHDDSVSLATGIGGHRKSSTDYAERWRIDSSSLECAIADLMALVRVTAERPATTSTTCVWESSGPAGNH